MGFEDLNKNVQDLLIVSKMEGNHSRLSDFPFICGFYVTSAALREYFIYWCFWALKPYTSIAFRESIG